MKVLYVIMILFLIPAIEVDYCHNIMCVTVVRVSGGDESIIAAGGNESISAAGGKGNVIVAGGHYSQTVHHHYHGQSSSQLTSGDNAVLGLSYSVN